MQDDCLLDPLNDIVSSTTGIIAKVVVEAEIGHRARFEKGDNLVGPSGPDPPIGHRPLIVEKYFHRSAQKAVRP